MSELPLGPDPDRKSGWTRAVELDTPGEEAVRATPLPEADAAVEEPAPAATLREVAEEEVPLMAASLSSIDPDPLPEDPSAELPAGLAETEPAAEAALAVMPVRDGPAAEGRAMAGAAEEAEAEGL